ncbi:MAG: hypothetical protein IJX67_02840 [Oscillospiraceae bacterium]|nr:hypothetical protein [Oscillospiraceae bacterium]
MAKNKCPQCGTKYNGNFCPNCSAAAPEGAGKKKKKWLLPTIIVVVAIFLIAGIGGGKDTKQPSGVQGDSSVTNNDASNTGESSNNEVEQSSTGKEVSIPETELYNKNGVIVTATEIKDGFFGPEVSITVSNETDKNIVVASRDLSVNGYMLSASGLYSDVAAGKKAIETMTLISSELSEAGIETVADIEFTLAVHDSDTFEDIDTSDLIKLSTSVAEGFTQPIDDSGDVIYDANGVRVICKGLKDDAIWDGCVVFYIENNNDKHITVYSENVSVNGFMVDESLWSNLRANTRSIEGMYLLTLDNIGLESVEEVETIEFNLRIIDEDWNNIATTDVITLTFN